MDNPLFTEIMSEVQLNLVRFLFRQLYLGAYNERKKLNNGNSYPFQSWWADFSESLE